MHKNQPENFARPKRAKNTKTHPEKPKMGKTGCVLGAGTVENRSEQVVADENTCERSYNI